MNKAKLSKTPRGYDNRLRQEQARQTRQRILDQAIRALADAGPHGITLAEVARGAGVSEPTLYRHFGSREQLYEALEERAQEEIGLPPVPGTLDEFPGHAAKLYATFGANAALLRALIRTGLGRDIREQGRAKRTRLLRNALAEHAPHLDEAGRDRVLGVLRVMVSWESFEKLTVELGLSTEAASTAIEWSLKALIQAVESGPAFG